MYIYIIQTNCPYGRRTIKIGSTKHPEARKWQYMTSNRFSVSYRSLFKIQLRPGRNLYRIDSVDWKDFLRDKDLYEKTICNDGGGTEWYYDDFPDVDYALL